MRRFRDGLLGMLACAALVACTPFPAPIPFPPPIPVLPPDDACGAPDLQYLVGQPASILATMKFTTQVRILRPGDPMTEDYGPTRLNIMIDLNERIDAVTCG